jgi:hypothetical protein
MVVEAPPLWLQISDMSASLAVNLIGIITVVWGAGRIVDATQRTAEAAERVAEITEGNGSSDPHALQGEDQGPEPTKSDERALWQSEQMFMAYAALKSQHAEFARTITEHDLSNMSWVKQTRYQLFLGSLLQA